MEHIVQGFGSDLEKLRAVSLLRNKIGRLLQADVWIMMTRLIPLWDQQDYSY